MHGVLSQAFAAHMYSTTLSSAALPLVVVSKADLAAVAGGGMKYCVASILAALAFALLLAIALSKATFAFAFAVALAAAKTATIVVAATVTATAIAALSTSEATIAAPAVTRP